MPHIEIGDDKQKQDCDGEKPMKLTDENADFMDCRPLIGTDQVRHNLIPPYLRKKAGELQEAVSRGQIASGEVDAVGTVNEESR